MGAICQLQKYIVEYQSLEPRLKLTPVYATIASLTHSLDGLILGFRRATTAEQSLYCKERNGRQETNRNDKNSNGIY